MESLTTLQTVEDDEFTCGVKAYKSGRTVYLSFEGVTISTAVDAYQRFSSISAKYCPIYNASFTDSITGKRIIIEQSGYIYCTTALSANSVVRGIATYISAS